MAGQSGAYVKGSGFALPDLQAPQRNPCEAFAELFPGFAFVRWQEHPGKDPNDRWRIVGFRATGFRWKEPGESLPGVIAKLIDHGNLVYAGNRAVGGACFHGLILTFEVVRC